MPEQKVNSLRSAVDAVIDQGRPDFGLVYVRSDRRTRLKWTGACLAAVAAAALILTLIQPTTGPSFDGQVAAFVGIVYEN